MSSLLIRGFVLGFAIAASPGPIFFLCLRRTLVRGRLYGLVSGLGVATADGFYAALAAFGVAALASTLVSGRRALALVGGFVLVVLGARILLERGKVVESGTPPNARGLAWAYASTLGLTITNPATIVSFAALAATLGLGAGGGIGRPATLVAGVLAGSAAWWCALAIAVSAMRARVTPGLVRGINTASGVVIAALGMLAIVSAFQFVP
ncbi:MAG TPA: LysE family transporter [Candidatus Baltobacterales bacterium]|nr:LysE family transporter [Candidatus Baltobacterales bacterium]